MATTNGTNGTTPKIILYTNHRCPYAHRAHITLKELSLPYEEVIIDLDTPRPQWYLDINPRGLVPSIKFGPNEEIIKESAIVSEFLAEEFGNGHIIPKSALERARINFFVDTWNTKISSHMFPTLLASDPEDKKTKSIAWAEAVEKEIEPLLANASPYFNGSSTLTFAEVHAAPFIVRWYALGKYEDLIPKSLIEKLDALPNFSRWAKAICDNPNVTKVVDWEGSVDGMRKRVDEFRAKAAAAKK